MYMRHPSRALLLACILILCSTWQPLLAAAGKDARVKVTVKSEFPAFRDRLKRNFLDVLEDHLRMHPSDDGRGYLGGDEEELSILLSYPLSLFEGKSSLVVRLVGLPEGSRHLSYSHPSSAKGDLSLHQSDLFIDEVVRTLVSDLEVALGYRPGVALKAGYLANRREVDLRSELDVQLIGPERPLPVLIKDEKKEEYRQIKALVQDERSRTVAPPSQEPPLRRKARRRAELEDRMGREVDREVRSDLLVEMADLYESEGLREDAKRALASSLEESPDLSTWLRWREMQGESRFPLTRFRRNNEGRGLNVNLLVGAHFDSNVSLEEVDQIVSSDTEDWRLDASFQLDKGWGFRWGELRHRTEWNVHNETYTRRREFDILDTDFLHSITRSGVHRGVNWDLSTGIGWHYLTGRGRRYMDGEILQLQGTFWMNPKNVVGLGFRWMGRDFADNIYDQDERTGHREVWSLSWQHRLSEAIHWSHRVVSLKEDLEDVTISYDAVGLQSEVELPSPWPWFEHWSPTFEYERRTYKGQGGKQTVGRKDAEFIYGVQTQVNVFEASHLIVGYFHTDHQSTRRVNRYRKEEVRISYLFSF